jgi:hypothetical protein
MPAPLRRNHRCRHLVVRAGVRRRSRELAAAAEAGLAERGVAIAELTSTVARRHARVEACRGNHIAESVKIVVVLHSLSRALFHRTGRRFAHWRITAHRDFS